MYLAMKYIWIVLCMCVCMLWCKRQLLTIQMAKRWLAIRPIRHRVECHVITAGTAPLTLSHRPNSTATEHQLHRPAASGPIAAQLRQLARCRHVLIGQAVALARRALVAAAASLRRQRMWWEAVRCRRPPMNHAMMLTSSWPVQPCADIN